MVDKKRRNGKGLSARPKQPDIASRLAGYAAALARNPDHPDGDEAQRLIDHLLEEDRVERLDDALRAADAIGFEAFECLRELIEHAATHVPVAPADAPHAEYEARLYALVFVGPKAAIADEIEPDTGAALVESLRDLGLIAADAQATFAATVASAVRADMLDWAAVSAFTAELFDCLAQGEEAPGLAATAQELPEPPTVVRMLAFATIEAPGSDPALEQSDSSEAETQWIASCAAKLAEEFESELDVVGVFPWFAALRVAAIMRRSLEIGALLSSVLASTQKEQGALAARLSLAEVEEFGVAVRLGLDDANDHRRLATVDFPVLANEHVEDAWAAMVDSLVEQGVPVPG
jgi:hypothetical protein